LNTQTVQEMKKNLCDEVMESSLYRLEGACSQEIYLPNPTHPTQDDCKMNKEVGHSQSVASRKVHIIQDTDAKSMQSLG